jgi:hypothetical protein
MKNITCESVGSTNCCMSCHDNADSGYEPMCELYDPNGNYAGEVCCRALNQRGDEIDELLEARR